MPKFKPILRVLLILFLLYAIFSSPQTAADAVGTLWDLLVKAVHNLGSFFDSLLKR